MALAGNKADMANKRTVEYEEAQAYAEDNALLFMETSAKVSIVFIFQHINLINKIRKIHSKNFNTAYLNLLYFRLQ